MEDINRDILEIRKENPFREWDDIAVIVNYKNGSDLTGNACRKRFKRYTDGMSTETPNYKRHDYGRNIARTIKGNYMIISDTHAPFTKSGAIQFLVSVKEKYNIKHVFHIGDVVDDYALSFFDKDPDSWGGGQELDKARDFLRNLVSEFPEVDVCIGNHDNRHLRQAVKAGLPSAYIREFSEILETPEGWNWNHSYLVNKDTIVEHGSSTGVRATYDRAMFTGKNVIQGHTHSYGGVLFVNDGFNQRWALNVGCLADDETYAMKYATDMKFKHTDGCGVVLENGTLPLFIPYEH